MVVFPSVTGSSTFESTFLDFQFSSLPIEYFSRSGPPEIHPILIQIPRQEGVCHPRL